VTVQPGTYTITENLADGYYQISAEGCQNVTIAAGETKVCTFTNYDYVVPTPGSGGNGLGSGAPQVLGASTEAPQEGKKEEGKVLGATMCNTIYLNDYLFFGRKNNPEQVKLLQSFLNEHLGLTLPVDGVYGKTTRDAVKAFQVKYLDEVLIPWKPFGLKSEKGTGNVYKTTKRKINLIKCADLNLPIPQLP
jgi:peptidoglycan hydrolase-like protein with peptidoglycan-binding domain